MTRKKYTARCGRAGRWMLRQRPPPQHLGEKLQQQRRKRKKALPLHLSERHPFLFRHTGEVPTIPLLRLMMLHSSTQQKGRPRRVPLLLLQWSSNKGVRLQWSSLTHTICLLHLRRWPALRRRASPPRRSSCGLTSTLGGAHLTAQRLRTHSHGECLNEVQK